MCGLLERPGCNCIEQRRSGPFVFYQHVSQIAKKTGSTTHNKCIDRVSGT